MVERREVAGEVETRWSYWEAAEVGGWQLTGCSRPSEGGGLEQPVSRLKDGGASTNKLGP